MDMFEEIYEIKKELPKFSTLMNRIKSHNFNAFEYITIIIGVICFLIGIISGNIFPACGTTSSFYSDVCVTTEFNVLLMISIWFFSFIGCLFLYGIGEIIRLLSEILEKNKKMM